jgi:hypothetical protein
MKLEILKCIMLGILCAVAITLVVVAVEVYSVTTGDN